MQSPFDIAADLDTPVSTWLKLAPLQPRYLLESVEGGVHLARYSFLGFGAALEFRLDADGLRAGSGQGARPAGRDELLNALRATLANAPRLAPVVPDLPFSGGLVGVSAYDLVRHFERLPKAPVHPDNPQVPEAAYVAAESLLVFDHLTRRIALLHAGSEAERLQLRARVIELLRGALPAAPVGGKQETAGQSLSREQFLQAVAAAKTSITRGDVYQLVLSVQFTGTHSIPPFEAYRALRLLNPSPYMFFIDLGDIQVAGSSPEALVKLRRGHA
ncbi:MAG: chorismate-binding protein, partial [Gammaproteobacteria bacterium]|nr:chorismate-binding protein [Gammaproteobacteria bacterium]